MTDSEDGASIFNRWDTLRLSDESPYIWNVDTLCLYLQRVRGDIMLAQSNDPPVVPPQNTWEPIGYLPLGMDWKRWALDAETREIRIWPTFPDKPLVVKTRSPVVVPPESTIAFYMNQPIWIEVAVLRNGKYMTLDKLSPRKLSHTWYGDHFEGELCYAIKSRARRSVEDLTDEPLRAVCRFSIQNSSEEALPVEKIRVKPEHFAVYKLRDQLWTNSIHVEFFGKDEPSHVKYENNVPETAKGATLVREPIKPYKSSSILDTVVFKSLLQPFQ